MEEQYRVFLIGGEDDEAAIFTLFDECDNCRLRCEYRDTAIEAIATDYFETLCRIRSRLAEEGLTPFCYGASLNVYPSGMARDMGAGLKAYRLTMGKSAKMADLVEIFADGSDVIPASVDAQAAYFEDWLVSLGLSTAPLNPPA